MKYPKVFRARITDKMMDDVRQAALDVGISQQQVFRSAVQMWLDELDRVQGTDSRIGSLAMEPEVHVAKRPAKGKGSPRDRRSTEDVAIRRLRAHVERVEADRG